jgi:hypothetical protein
MHRRILLAALALAPTAVAQNWYVPNNDPTIGTCNAIPFGSGPGSSFAQCKYQTRFLASDLGAVANLITGLGYAACNTGRAHFDQIEIVLDHIPATQTTSTTFASNLTPAAVTVLTATDYTWNVTANTWNEIGLQVPFVFNGFDDVIMQITIVNGQAPGSFRRDVRQRIYWTAAAGTPPATGTAGNAAGKVEVSMLMARTSSHGDGCVGTNGTPTVGFTGSPQVGNTISFDLANGVPGGIALFLAGTTNAAPFPIDLAPFGAPSCFAYTDLASTAVLLLDAGGAGSTPIPIPASLVGFRFYGQYAVLDPAANAFGFTTSNYLHVLTGN